MEFDFYYGLQSQTFSFYRIPKLLFTDPRFSSLSAEAKTLYGILLDRMDLSMKNGWLDKQNRSDLTSRQVVGKLEAADIVGKKSGESGRQVQRYIRLTELIPQLLDMVDHKQLAFNPAVELSYLKKEEQEQFLEAMEYAQATPSLSQAQRVKKLSQSGECTLDAMCDIMDEVKKGDLDRITIRNDVLKKYFPKSYTPKQMEDTIIRLLEQWQKKRQRSQER